MSFFGDRVKVEREKLGWSQLALAKKAGLDKQTVFRIESGSNTRRATMTALAKALGVSLSSLMDDPSPRDSGDRDQQTPAERLQEIITYLNSLDTQARTDFINALAPVLDLARRSDVAKSREPASKHGR